MLSKRRKMRFVYLLPAFIAIIRVGITLWFLISNPLDLPLRFFQLIHLGIYAVSMFSFYRLYRDGVPILSLVAPTLVHAIVIFIFKKMIVIVPFAVLFTLDVVFLASKGIKANLYPFDIEGDSDDEDFFEDEELEGNAE